MKLLQVFNQYRSAFNGEDSVIKTIDSIAQEQGWESELLLRSSQGIDRSLAAKMGAFWNGIYSRSAYREMRSKLRRESHPDIVHVHNLYPRFSPSVLVACREQNLPVVMTVHNHGLTCPKSDHLYQGQICEKCVGGKEYHCVLQNCRNNIFESIAYATRSTVARRLRLFHDNVTTVIALTEFARQRFLQIGFAEEQVEVLPNYFHNPQEPVVGKRGDYVAYAGRLSSEKGVESLLEAASQTPDIPIRVAGDGPLAQSLRERASDNVTFMGRLERDEINDFYLNARFVVLPSVCFEMCPLVISEAMSLGLPVVASRIGGLAELVDDGVTGLLFEPGNSNELAQCLRKMWQSPSTSREMGESALQFAVQNFGRRNYWNRLVEIYERAAQRCGKTLALNQPSLEPMTVC